MARDARAPRVVLGVDGGGTKTHALVLDEHGAVLGTGTAGPSNWESIGVDGARDAVVAAGNAALRAANAKRNAVAAAAFALAGYDWPSDDARLAPVIGALKLSGPQRLVNDAVAALRAGIDGGPGVASVAGTGGSTCGRNRAGTVCRTFAAALGEGAGAGGIVRDALHAIASEYHASAEPTALTPAILAATGFDSTPALFEAMLRDGRSVASSGLAPVVLEAAAAHDAVAHAIVAAAGSQHGRDVIGVARRLAMVDDDFCVVRAGGVHTAGSLAFDGAFTHTVAAALPHVAFTTLQQPPVVGAALLALESIGVASATVAPLSL